MTVDHAALDEGGQLADVLVPGPEPGTAYLVDGRGKAHQVRGVISRRTGSTQRRRGVPQAPPRDLDPLPPETETAARQSAKAGTRNDADDFFRLPAVDTILASSRPWAQALTGHPGTTALAWSGGPVPEAAHGRVVLLLDLLLPDVVMDVLAAGPVTAVIPVYTHRGLVCFGPELRPGTCPCPVDLAVRVSSSCGYGAVADAVVLAGRREAEPFGAWSPFRTFSPGALVKLLGDGLATLADQPGSGSVVAIDTRSGTRQTGRVLPLPGRYGHQDQLRPDSVLVRLADRAARTVKNAAPGAPVGAQPGADVVDALFGPVVRLEELAPEPGEPEALHAWAALVADVGRHTTWVPDQTGTGMAFDREMARGAAVGEAMERYGGQIPPADLIEASETDLEAAGRRFLPLREWNVFADDQYDRPGFPYRRPVPGERIAWTTAVDLDDGAPTLVPSSAVVLGHGRRTLAADLRTAPALAGIAAGRDAAAAVQAGLLELIERDATMRWWHCGDPAVRLDLSGTPLADVLSRGADDRVRVWWLLLPTEVGVPVVAACMSDERSGTVGVGFAARLDAAAAVAKATAEAWQLRRLNLALLDEDSSLWRQVRAGRLRFPLRPYRADRCYRASFADDLSDMRNLTHNLQFYLDPGQAAAALPRLTAGPVVHLRDLPPARLREGADLAAAVTRAGWRVLHVDLTPPDVRAMGLSVQRVLSPDLCPNTAAATPPLGHPRLSGRVVNLQPLPHA